MKQNTSHAVMAQRNVEDKDSFDDFPTPPWATRALLEHVVADKLHLRKQTCLEPACGQGHMAKVLSEYFGAVKASDIQGFGYGDRVDFLTAPYQVGQFDWVITNPPFRLGEEFVLRGLSIARVGVAILARTVFIESVGRFERIFKDNPPTVFAQFTERVPMVKGRLDRKASTATGYAWLVWDKTSRRNSRLGWVPPCRKQLERDSDYTVPERPLPVSEGLFAVHQRPAIERGNVTETKKQADLFGVANARGNSSDHETRDNEHN